MLENMKFNAIVLAAGMGTRMRPITNNIPKPLIEICNRPLLENILINLDNAGAGRVAINTHYLNEKVNAFIERSRFRERVEIFHEPEILWTGGPIVNARSVLREHESFMLHNGDILADVDLKEMADVHFRSGAAVTMLTLDGPENRVLVSPEGEILDINRMSGADPSRGTYRTYGGIFMASRRMFEYLPQEPCSCSSIEVIVEMLKADPGSVRAYNPGGFYWNDLGTVERYFQAHRDIIERKMCRLPELPPILDNFLLADGVEARRESLSGFVCAGHGCKVAAGAHVENCILLDGASVGPNEFHINEVIGYDYSIHRDFAILKELKLLKDVDWQRCRISSLREYGSARGFFRLADGDSRILMVSDASDADFDRFVDVGRFLAEHKLHTPEIYDFSREEFSVLMEDLGNVMLFNRWSEARGDVNVLNEYYRKVIDVLVDFQLRGTLALKTNGSPQMRIFDYDYLRWETSYFTRNMLYGLCGLSEEDAPGLEAEFDALAAAVDAHPKIFMHRDFQSQNIMMCDGRVRFVDYQGSRIGPVGYDIMSLLRDPYVKLPYELRCTLLNYYFERFLASPLNEYVRTPAQFRVYAVLGGLQRNMQALGAYGFLSREKGKVHYLDFVPQAVAYLREGLDELRDLRCGVELAALENCWDAVDKTAKRLKKQA